MAPRAPPLCGHADAVLAAKDEASGLLPSSVAASIKSAVDGKLENCTVTSMVSSDWAIAVACKGGGAVAWGCDGEFLAPSMPQRFGHFVLNLLVL